MLLVRAYFLFPPFQVPIYNILNENVNGKLAIFEFKNKGKLSSTSQQYVAEVVLISELRGDIEKK